jgi:hypothetical protein
MARRAVCPARSRARPRQAVASHKINATIASPPTSSIARPGALGVSLARLGITPLAFPGRTKAPSIIYGRLAAGILVLIYFMATESP